MTHTLKSLVAGTALAAWWLIGVLVMDVIKYAILGWPLEPW